MEKEIQEPATSVIGWILSRPEGKQFLSACLFVISILAGVIVWQEVRYGNVIDKSQKSDLDHKNELKECKQETINILQAANSDAQKMRDSLYIMGMKQKEIETKINKRIK